MVRGRKNAYTGLVSIIMLLAFCAVVSAESWQFSVGPNYRGFGDIDFETYQFNNPIYQDYIDADDDEALNLLQYPTPNLPGSAANAAMLLDISNSEATVRNVTFEGADKELDAAPGMVIGASKSFNESWLMDLSLVTIFTDNDETFNNSTVAETTYALNSIFPQVANYSSQIASPTGTPADITTSLEFDTEVDVYTFGAGVSYRHFLGPLAVTAGAGPSVTLADYDISRKETVTWVGGAGNVYPPQEEDDDGLKVRAGGYADVGVSYNFTESMGVEMSGRYDWIPDELHTDFADINLSGFSGELKFMYTF